MSRSELIGTVSQVAIGGAAIESQILKGMLTEMKPSGAGLGPAAKNLTERECEILSLVAEG